MRKIKAIVPSCAALFLCSCASIVSKSVYNVRLDSSPQKATVIISNRFGKEIYHGTTPCQTRLKPNAGYFRKAMYSITFTKNGYLEKTIELNADINGWYFGNVIFGGLIGLLVVDPATGAMYKLNSTSINETLASSTQVSAANQTRELKIYDINEVPENWKKDLVEITVAL